MRKIILSIGLLAYLSFLNFQCRGPEKELKTLSDVDTVEQELAVELDSATGLVIDEGFQLVKGNCTPCHSARLITQNRASREGWKEMIQWMQETQNLWPLGQNEEIILDYLAKNYAPGKTGRRAPLKDIEWYELDKN